MNFENIIKLVPTFLPDDVSYSPTMCVGSDVGYYVHLIKFTAVSLLTHEKLSIGEAEENKLTGR